MDRMANGSSHLFAGKARIIAQYLINCLAIADLLQDEIHTNARTRDDGLAAQHRRIRLNTWY
jgi:hypothetical protein